MISYNDLSKNPFGRIHENDSWLLETRMVDIFLLEINKPDRNRYSHSNYYFPECAIPNVKIFRESFI